MCKCIIVCSLAAISDENFSNKTCLEAMFIVSKPAASIHYSGMMPTFTDIQGHWVQTSTKQCQHDSPTCAYVLYNAGSSDRVTASIFHDLCSARVYL